MINASFEMDFSALEEFGKTGVRKAMRIALNRAAAPVKAAVVGSAQRIARFGFLAKAIRIKTKIYPSGNGVVIIGPSAKYTRQKGKITRGPNIGQPRRFIPANYAHFLDSGTKHAGKNPYIAPAYQSAGRRFGQQVLEEYRKEFAKLKSK